ESAGLPPPQAHARQEPPGRAAGSEHEDDGREASKNEERGADQLREKEPQGRPGRVHGFWFFVNRGRGDAPGSRAGSGSPSAASREDPSAAREASRRQVSPQAPPGSTAPLACARLGEPSRRSRDPPPSTPESPPSRGPPQPGGNARHRSDPFMFR